MSVVASLSDRSDSGSVTPMLHAEAASYDGNLGDAEDTYEEYVVPGSRVIDSLYINGELNSSQLDLLVTNENGLAADEDTTRLNMEMVSMCKNLIAHSTSFFSDYKSQSIKERNAKVSELESKYYTDMQAQEDIINSLRETVGENKREHALHVVKLEATSDAVSSLLIKKLNGQKELLAKRKIFQMWLLRTQQEQHISELAVMATKFYRRRVLSRVFSSLAVEARTNMKHRLTREKKAKIDDVTSKLITDYEKKLNQLQRELDEAHRMLNQESNSRKQFEGDLKRVFLKNLTQMNMEAYSLFNGGEGPNEVEVQGQSQAQQGDLNRVSNVSVPSAPGVIRGMTPTTGADDEPQGRTRAPSVHVINHASTVQSAKLYTPAPGSYVYPQTDAMMQRPTSVVITNNALHPKPLATVRFANNVSGTGSNSHCHSHNHSHSRAGNSAPGRTTRQSTSPPAAVPKKHIANSRLQETLGIDMRHNVDMRASIENQIPRTYPGVKPTPL